jgi:hypothetical protein
MVGLNDWLTLRVYPPRLGCAARGQPLSFALRWVVMFSRPGWATDEEVEEARAVSRRLGAFEAGSLQTSVAARELGKLEPKPGVKLIALLIALARAGGRRDALLVESIGRALLPPPDEVLPEEHREALLVAALELELPEVAGLFIAPDPVLGADGDRPPKPDPAIAHLTLGHKKMLARQANPDMLARLAAEGEPSVVRNILMNPRLDESLVVRICARRPIRAEVFREVWASRKWSSREMIRQAIVQNPYCEPELALKVLPLMAERTLVLVARNLHLHPTVRAAAERLRRKRPVEAVE